MVRAWHRAERRAPAEAWRIVLQLAGVLRTAVRLEPCCRRRRDGVRARSRVAAGSRPRRGPRAAPDPRPAGQGRVDRVPRGGRVADGQGAGADDAARGRRGAARGRAAPSRRSWRRTRRVHVRRPVRPRQDAAARRGRRGQRRPGGLVLESWASPTWSAAEPTSLRWSCCSRRCCSRWPKRCRPPNGRWGGRSASRSFRRSFLLGYAHRIGERLQTARRRATAEAAAEHDVDLLPVLRSRQAAVEQRVAELFPRVRTTRSRASVDAGGWYAGREAPSAPTSAAPVVPALTPDFGSAASATRVDQRRPPATR